VPPNLQTALLDLLHEVQGTEVKLIIGGGYGIYLRTEHVRRLGARTLFEEKPEARSTNDLDLFLRPELLSKAEKLKPLKEAFDRLGYSTVPGAEKYQFVKPGPEGSEAGGHKIDILTGPESDFVGKGVKIDNRRIHPIPSIGIHAHPTNEAVTLEEGLIPVTIHGELDSGESFESEIFLPHSYTFLMMKLFAFKDRLKDKDKEFGRYHALDMYSVLATTTEEEWKKAEELRDKYAEESKISEAGELIKEHFSAENRLGIIRLKESRYYRPELQIEEFMSALQELFPVR
jgi:hypothetical protein